MAQRKRRRHQQEASPLEVGIGLIAFVGLCFASPILAWMLQRPWAFALSSLMACTATIGITGLVFILTKTASARRKRELLAKKNLLEFSPIEFEKYVALIFQRKGYRTRLCGGAGDQGIDIEARRKNEYVVIQCKRYTGNVASSMVREFGGVLLHENPTKGYLVTTGDFTPDGWAYARGKPMELVNLDKLIHWQQELKIGPYAAPVQESRLSTVTGFSLGQWIVLISLGLSILSMLGLLIGVLVDNF